MNIHQIIPLGAVLRIKKEKFSLGVSFICSLITLHVFVYALKISGLEVIYGYQSLITPENMLELKDTVSRSVLSASVLSIPILYGLCYFFHSTFQVLEKGELKTSLLIGGILATFLIFGTNLYLSDKLYIDSVTQTIIHIFELIPITTALVVRIFSFFPKIENYFISNSVLNSLGAFFLKKTFIKLFLLFFVAWGCLFLFVYPGIYATDAAWQYDWYIKGQISAHHPPLHTVWLGACIDFGTHYLGSTQRGLFVYSISQLTLSSCLMAYFYANIKNYLPKQYLGIFTLLTAFLPINAMIVLLASKDAIFSLLFINCSVFFYQIAQNTALLRNPKFLMKVFAFTVLMCLFRNNGIYALVLGAIMMYFILNKYKQEFALLVSIILVVFTVIQFGFKSVGITPAPVKMMLSVPVQQISRAYRDRPECLIPSDKEIVVEYIPNIQSYTPRISDTAMVNFNEQRFMSSALEFLGLWWRVGKCAFPTYIEAFMSNTIGLWYPDMIYRDPGAWHPYLPYHDNNYEYGLYRVPQIPRESIISWEPSYFETMENSPYYQKIPLISFLFNPGCYVWLYFLYVLYCLRTKRIVQLAPFTLMLGLYITILMGPVVLVRYVYPIMLAFPFVFLSNNFQLKSEK